MHLNELNFFLNIIYIHFPLSESFLIQCKILTDLLPKIVSSKTFALQNNLNSTIEFSVTITVNFSFQFGEVVFFLTEVFFD